MEQTSIPRTNLHSELTARLRRMIMNGELHAGEKVPERLLCSRFGVSRTPLREVLKVLAAEGLVQLLPNRGCVVASISEAEIDDLFPIMGALEALAGELACRRITAAALKRLHAMHDEMVRHYKAGKFAPYIDLNREIHDSLFQIAGNAALTGLYNNLMIRIHSVRYIARKSPARWQQAVEDHVRMMEALDARDGKRLARILREHLVHKAETVKESLADAHSVRQNPTGTRKRRTAGHVNQPVG